MVIALRENLNRIIGLRNMRGLFLVAVAAGCLLPRESVALLSGIKSSSLGCATTMYPWKAQIIKCRRDDRRRALFSSSTSTNGIDLASTTSTKKAVAKVATTGQKRLASGMAFLTGWADVALYFKYKTFATMMTGNSMWMAQAAVESRYTDVCYYFSVIVCYVLGIAAFRLSNLKIKSKSLTYFCAPAVMALFVGSDFIMNLTSKRWLPVTLLATGFGIINSVGSEVRRCET
jgi:hypothetical protein